MATDPRIRNDQSIGLETNARAREIERRSRISFNTGRTATDVVQKVNRYQANQNAPATTLRFPHDTPKYYMTMEIGDYRRTIIDGPGVVHLDNSRTIVLPMPLELVDKNEVDYDEKEIGAAIGAAWNWASMSASSQAAAAKSLTAPGTAFGNAIDSLNSTIAPNLRSTVDTLAANPGGKTEGAVGGLVAGTLMNGIDSLPIANALRSLFGYSPNQWLTVLLKGPKYKRYSYTWNLVPNNREEADTINKMVRLIQDAKCPDLKLFDLVFGFPSIFRLHFKVDSQEHKYLFEFKPSVIESCEVQYMNTFYHGPNGENPPESVKLRCSFLELEFWLKGDYNK